MFDETHYVPILKAKAGELDALRDTSPLRKGSAMTPVLELPGNVKAAIAKAVATSWGTADRIFIDAQIFDNDSAEALMAGIARAGVRIVPTTSFDKDANFQRAIARIAKDSGFGICFRLGSSALVEEEAVNQLEDLLSDLSVTPEEVDFIIDFGEVPRASIRETVILAQSVMGVIPRLERWKSLTVAWSAFPKSLSDLKRNSITPFPRLEWRAWNALRSTAISRVPSFADYAINHPRREDSEVKFRPAPNLRYTTPTDYLIFRGQKSAGAEQQRTICQKLIEMTEFQGVDFSEGDSFISKCAAGQTGPGSPTTWRSVGTNHHLAIVTEQLSNLPGA